MAMAIKMEPNTHNQGSQIAAGSRKEVEYSFVDGNINDTPEYQHDHGQLFLVHGELYEESAEEGRKQVV